MRTKLVGMLVGLGVLVASTAPSLACAYHDQQASAAQQHTADATQSGTSSNQ